MKMIPPEISLRNPSSAEASVFRLLKQVELPGSIALHSVNLSEHRYKVCGEIDFLLLGQAGLFVLEVKGGRVGCRDGVWTFTNRYGVEARKTEGPFDQARSATFSLLDRLEKLLPAAVQRKFLFGWAVLFPDQEFTEKSVEWAPEMVVGREDCRSPADLLRSLRRLMKYWAEKEKGRGPLTAGDVKAIRDALRPDFDLVPSLRVRAHDADSALESLTEAQYRLLDATEANERILCDGGAGTGKTFLAAEVARREAAAGHRVLLTCRSEILAGFLRAQPDVAGDNCDIKALARLRLAPPDGRFDTLVVDEGQDLVNFDDLAVLDSLLVGGLAGGRWRMFYDPNNQAGLIGDFEPEAQELLASTQPVRVHLLDNCRNTEEVVLDVQRVLAADIGVSSAGAGLPVVWRFWKTRQDEAQIVTDHLERLEQDSVDPAEIAVLGGGTITDSCVSVLAPSLRNRIEWLNTETLIRPPVGRIGYSTIGDFKGLENLFIVVVDIADDVDDDELRRLLYVGMTRARASLIVCLPATLRHRIAAIHEQVAGDHTHDRAGD